MTLNEKVQKIINRLEKISLKNDLYFEFRELSKEIRFIFKTPNNEYMFVISFTYVQLSHLHEIEIISHIVTRLTVEGLL